MERVSYLSVWVCGMCVAVSVYYINVTAFVFVVVVLVSKIFSRDEGGEKLREGWGEAELL